jgi:hypothetical protein
MFFNYKLFFKLTIQVLFQHRAVYGPLTPKRIKRLLFWYTVMPLLQLLTAFCFLLDDLLFPAYRRQKVEKPLFILSNFRSGSTLLHRLLAQDEDNFTATRIWEIYLAPSITQRVVVRGIVAFDRRWLGGWLNRKIDALDQRVLGGIQMHHTGLHMVDEDEGLMIHNWTSIFLVFVFPDIKSFEPYFFFERQLDPKTQYKAMTFYHKCIQRHIYFHDGKRYVAKTPAFCVKLENLLRYFPDAEFIYLARNPVDMIASKTSYFNFCWQYFNNLPPYPFTDFMLRFTKFWYTYPLARLEALPEDRYLVVKYQQLTQGLSSIIEQIYHKFGLTISPRFEAILAGAVAHSKTYNSQHNYSLEQMDYSPQQIYNNYREVFDRFGFSLNGRAMMSESLEITLQDVE